VIHIIDYGLGNVQAFVNLYKKLGMETVRAKSESDLNGVSHLILPGVGAFDHAMQLFDASGMRGAVERLVRVDKVPVLGVCVGMQILANTSDEGVCDGLGWVGGSVSSFAGHKSSASLPMPHMGWNDVVPVAGSPLFKGFSGDTRFYFLHSYYFNCAESMHVAARSAYGFDFDCAVQNDNVFGVQFHPEKSHHWGAALLKNFAEL
jgi:imidazole glycerol-phosphate synthase subunit HisH